MADKEIPIELTMGQAIELSSEISILPIEVYGCVVRLGVTAPEAIRVDRAEIALQRQKARARDLSDARGAE